MCNDADTAIFVNEANAAGQRSINTYSIRFRKNVFRCSGNAFFSKLFAIVILETVPTATNF